MILDQLAEKNPEALLLEPRSAFDKCVTGTAVRDGDYGKPVAVYSIEKILQVLVQEDGMSEEDATEYLDYNIVGGWLGEGTPIYE